MTIKTLIRLLIDLVAFTGGTQVHLITQDTASIFLQAENQSTDPDTLFQVSSVLSFPPVDVVVIPKLLSTIKKLIWLLSDLWAIIWRTQLHLITKDTASMFSQASNQSTDPD